MNITLSANNNADIYVLPIVPPGIEINSPQKNETFEGLKGDLTLIGNPGLKEISISSFSGNQATVGANWVIVQTNIDGVVTGAASSVGGDIATFNGVSGKIIQDSGMSVSTNTALGTSNVLLPTQNAVKTYADTKVAKSGDTMTGNLIFNNGVFLYGKNTSGDLRAFAYIAGNNNVNLGDQSSATYILGTALNYWDGSNPYAVWQDKNCAASVASSGYQKLASGLIIQWGSATAGSETLSGGWYNASAAVTFPIAFTTACYVVNATMLTALDGTFCSSVTTPSTTGTTLWSIANVTGRAASQVIRYVAIGK